MKTVAQRVKRSVNNARGQYLHYPLLRGWKLLEFKSGKTTFGEPEKKGQQMISTPTWVLLFNLFLTVFMFIKELAIIIN